MGPRLLSHPRDLSDSFRQQLSRHSQSFSPAAIWRLVCYDLLWSTRLASVESIFRALHMLKGASKHFWPALWRASESHGGLRMWSSNAAEAYGANADKVGGTGVRAAIGLLETNFRTVCTPGLPNAFAGWH